MHPAAATNNWSRCLLRSISSPHGLFIRRLQEFTICPRVMPSSEGKKKHGFSLRGLLFWRWFFRPSRPFMQRDASKWPRSCSDLGQLAVLPGPVQGFLLSFFIWSLFLTAGLNEASWCHSSFAFSACPSVFQRLTSYLWLWNFGCSAWALGTTFLLQNN